jgi:amino-acid N-acetyltransferase
LNNVVVRTATTADAAALHALITAHQTEGHLLPRELDEINRHVRQFVVADVNGAIAACAELAPLSSKVAEVRSLVVSRHFRRGGVAGRLVGELRARARAAGFDTLCAFTHDAHFFVRQNFSIVPHVSIPEKVSKDCVGCPMFRHCGQYAMVLPLHEVVRYGIPQSPLHRVAVA